MSLFRSRSSTEEVSSPLSSLSSSSESVSMAVVAEAPPAPPPAPLRAADFPVDSLYSCSAVDRLHSRLFVQKSFLQSLADLMPPKPAAICCQFLPCARISVRSWSTSASLQQRRMSALVVAFPPMPLPPAPAALFSPAADEAAADVELTELVTMPILRLMRMTQRAQPMRASTGMSSSAAYRCRCSSGISTHCTGSVFRCFNLRLILQLEMGHCRQTCFWWHFLQTRSPARYSAIL